MIIESRGFVAQVNTPSTGWYKVALAHAPNVEVSGVSLKNTVLNVGQTVIVFQYGQWGTAINEFGFTELANNLNFESLRGQIQLVPQVFEYCAQNAPGQVAASYIAEKAGNKGQRYFPAIITAISGSNLACKDYFNKTLGLLPVASDLSAGDFSVDDMVLIQTTFEGHVMMVLGWWLTVPETLKSYVCISQNGDASKNYFRNILESTEIEIDALTTSAKFIFINDIPYDISISGNVITRKNLLTLIEKSITITGAASITIHDGLYVGTSFIHGFKSGFSKFVRVSQDFETFDEYTVSFAFPVASITNINMLGLYSDGKILLLVTGFDGLNTQKEVAILLENYTVDYESGLDEFFALRPLPATLTVLGCANTEKIYGFNLGKLIKYDPRTESIVQYDDFDITDLAIILDCNEINDYVFFIYSGIDEASSRIVTFNKTTFARTEYQYLIDGNSPKYTSGQWIKRKAGDI